MEFPLLTLYRWLLLFIAIGILVFGLASVLLEAQVLRGHITGFSFIYCTGTAFTALGVAVFSEVIRLFQRMESHLHDLNYKATQLMAKREETPNSRTLYSW